MHSVYQHPEQYFPAKDFNGDLIGGEKYLNCCRQLFRWGKIKMAGNASYRCPVCEKMFAGKRFVNGHLVEEHWQAMAAKLREFVKEAVEMEGEGTTRREGKGNWRCEGCGAGFSQRSSLNRHRKLNCPKREVMEGLEEMEVVQVEMEEGEMVLEDPLGF